MRRSHPVSARGNVRTENIDLVVRKCLPTLCLVPENRVIIE